MNVNAETAYPSLQSCDEEGKKDVHQIYSSVTVLQEPFCI